MENLTVVDALDAVKVLKEWCGDIESCSECVFGQEGACDICKNPPKGWRVKNCPEV